MKKIYQSEEEKRKAMRIYRKKYYKKNRDKLLQYARSYYRKCYIRKSLPLPINYSDNANFENRLLELEKEIKELKLDFEEVLKDNKKLQDLVKWGKK